MNCNSVHGACIFKLYHRTRLTARSALVPPDHPQSGPSTWDAPRMANSPPCWSLTPPFHTDPTYPKGSFPSSLKGSVCSAEVPWRAKDITMPFTTSAKNLKSNPLNPYVERPQKTGECRKLTVLLTCPQSCPSCEDI